ncbi:DUF6308 family protein [Rhodococcus opacus]|uniref:DUF6308 family protein n=1 Tax=Rhodococcus opacus TaxID=37919 RepID=UPI001F2604D2|nr:DUF6308 family protein [Rhodococcus opacus]
MSRRIPTPGRAPATGWGEADRFTADDPVAVTFLSVQVLPMAARAILDTIAEALNASLRAVDPDRELVDEPDPLGPGWLAWDFGNGAARPAERGLDECDEADRLGPTGVRCDRLDGRQEPRSGRTRSAMNRSRMRGTG